MVTQFIGTKKGEDFITASELSKILNVKNVLLEKILIETDAPYLTPVPFRGKQNETSYVSYVGKYLAQLKEIDEVLLQQQIYNNYIRMKEN